MLTLVGGVFMVLISFAKYLCSLFIVFLLIGFIHELGHVIMGKLVGVKGLSIQVGSGERLFGTKRVVVRKNLFKFWSCRWSEFPNYMKSKKVLFLLGGGLGNFIFFVLCHLYIVKVNPRGDLLSFVLLFRKANFLMGILNLLPIKLQGCNCDGLQIYQLMKYGKSCFKSDGNDALKVGE